MASRILHLASCFDASPAGHSSWLTTHLCRRGIRTLSAFIVPEDRMTMAAAGCPFACEIMATDARSFSTDPRAQRSTALSPTGSSPIIRIFISVAPNLPNICSTECTTASSMACAETGSFVRNLTRRYRCPFLFVACRPPHDSDAFFQLGLLRSQAVLFDDRQRNLRHALKCSFEREAEHMQNGCHIPWGS
jgi:hypothetical protein